MDKCMGCMRDYEERNPACPVCGYPKGQSRKERKQFPQSLPPGSILQGRFIIGRVLSASDFSFVYLSWDALLEKRVAVREYFPFGLAVRKSGKELLFPNAADQEVFEKGRNSFQEEGLLLGKHQDAPQIIEVYRVIEENHTSYQVMEYMEGCTLKDWVEKKAPYPPMSLREVVFGIADAVEALQKRNLCHYGLSPEHIYLQEDSRIRLFAFGMAKKELVRHLDGRRLRLFEERYTAPEVLLGEEADRRADLYSLGTVLFTAYTGRKPKQSLRRRKHPRRLRLPDRSETDPLGNLAETVNALAEVRPENRPEWQDVFAALHGEG